MGVKVARNTEHGTGSVRSWGAESRAWVHAHRDVGKLGKDGAVALLKRVHKLLRAPRRLEEEGQALKVRLREKRRRGAKDAKSDGASGRIKEPRHPRHHLRNARVCHEEDDDRGRHLAQRTREAFTSSNDEN